MANIRTNITNAYQTTLSAELSAVGLSMQLTDVTGLTVPFYLVIEPTDSGQREYVYVTELIGNTATLASRYLSGSAAGSGLTHPIGSVVRMSVMAQHLTDINDRVEDVQSQVNSLSDHGSLTGLGDDDHTQYYNSARHTKAVHDALAIDHGGLSGKADDDHTQYYNAARHTKAVHDALAIDHGALSGKSDDDHTQYVKADGTRAFTGVVSGITPTASAHLATKAYVDSSGTTDHGGLTGLGDDDHTQYYNAARHTKAVHDALSINADTVDGQHASAFAGSSHTHGAADIASGTISVSRLPTSSWGHMLPSTDNAFDLGSSSFSWRRLYAWAIYDETGQAVVDLSGPTFIPNTAFSAEVLFNGETNWGYDPPVDNTGPTMRLDNTSPHRVEIGAGFSSEVHKMGIVPVDLAKSVFSRLEGVHFDYRKNASIAKLFSEKGWAWEQGRPSGRMGVIAEQMEQVVPEWVSTWRGEKVINWDGLQPDWFGDYLALRAFVLDRLS